MTHFSTITYLQMMRAPEKSPPPRPLRPHAVLRAHHPTVSFYRYLYETVGDDWFWYERKVMDDETLKAIIDDQHVEIYVLYIEGVPAGYCELDRRQENEIELAYFGLVPEFIGRGFGGYFLRWAIDTAWQYNPKRVWVHTCSEDHVNALPTYQKAGFEPYRQETVELDDPVLLEWMEQKKNEGA